MARRGSGLHLTKKGRKKINFTDNLKKKQDEKQYQQIQNKQRNNESSDSGKTKQGKPKTKAQIMATKNIKKYGGTASAAKANKEAMRLKIKKKYLASKKKKK